MPVQRLRLKTPVSLETIVRFFIAINWEWWENKHNSLFGRSAEAQYVLMEYINGDCNHEKRKHLSVEMGYIVDKFQEWLLDSWEEV